MNVPKFTTHTVFDINSRRSKCQMTWRIDQMSTLTEINTVNVPLTVLLSKYLCWDRLVVGFYIYYARSLLAVETSIVTAKYFWFGAKISNGFEVWRLKTFRDQQKMYFYYYLQHLGSVLWYALGVRGNALPA